MDSRPDHPETRRSDTGRPGKKRKRRPRSRRPAPHGAPVKQGGRWNHVYSAIDLGTNNCRLLVASPAARGFRVIDSFSRIVRLGEGVSRTGQLSDAAIERTLSALEVCADKIRKRGVSRLRNIATAACRLAENHHDFLQRVSDRTGLEFDIISAEEEARLAAMGCRSLYSKDANYVLVFDIGGGSTELTLMHNRRRRRPTLQTWTSLQRGVVSLAEHYGGEHITPDIYAAMVAEVSSMLAPFLAEVRAVLGQADHGQKLQLIGTSGTVTTVAGVYLQLPRYDRAKVDGMWMSHDDITATTQQLARMDYATRAAQPCIGRERADLVLAGCAIFEAIYTSFDVDRVRVADRGLREGILLELMRAADQEEVVP